MRSVADRRLAAVLLVVLGVASACTSDDSDEVALATRCMRAANDNRAKLSASWLSSAEVEVQGDMVTVRTEVPIGISIGGRIKFRYWTYHCRDHGDRMEFLGYETRR